MSEFAQNEVSAAIWRWQKTTELPKRYESVKRVGKAVAQAVIMLTVAGWLNFARGHTLPAAGLLGLALFVLLSAIFSPRAYSLFERAVGAVARGAGAVITWLLLTPFFYGVFVPGRIILSLRGRDPLHRKFPSDEPTYWVPWKPDPTRRHYYKQYR